MPVNEQFAGRVYSPAAPYGGSAAKIKGVAEAGGNPHPVDTHTGVGASRGGRRALQPPPVPTPLSPGGQVGVVLAHERGVIYQGGPPRAG